MHRNSYHGNTLAARGGVIEYSPVLRNTYLLLSLTVLFSALMSYVAMITYAAPVPFVIQLVGMFGLLFAVQACKDSALGILMTFLFTGFMGYTLGPTLNLFIYHFSNGYELIMTALGATGTIFLALSAYVVSTEKDFSYMGGLLSAAILILFIASLIGIIFAMPFLQILLSAGIAIVFSGMIMYETSMILYGGETNYILATLQLYISILNLFMSLLNLLAMFSGRD